MFQDYPDFPNTSQHIIAGVHCLWESQSYGAARLATGEVQSRSGSSLAGVVGGFAVGAITAGATAYYFLQVG